MNTKITRESVLNEILDIPNKEILLELPTNFGKSKIAIEILNHRKIENVLVVVPTNVLKENWKKELIKWNYKGNVTYTTYKSLHKYIGKWNAVVFDECHHLSERCREFLSSFTIDNTLLLSATVNKNIKKDFFRVFKNLYIYKIHIKDAIENEVLPNPRVILIPLALDNTKANITMTFNDKLKGSYIRLPYSQIWTAKKSKTKKYIIECTERQYYNEISRTIEWYKSKRYMTAMKNIWLHKCNIRLKWLSMRKTLIVKDILAKLTRYRTLTFCGSIEQSRILCRYCINSENKRESLNNLSNFNDKKISHITAVNMLNEGMNLVDCKIGLYANLNSSETLVIQRMGRILRHKSPVMIIPYYVNTREQDIVKDMLENYDKDLITIIDNIDDLKI